MCVFTPMGLIRLIAIFIFIIIHFSLVMLSPLAFQQPHRHNIMTPCWCSNAYTAFESSPPRSSDLKAVAHQPQVGCDYNAHVYFDECSAEEIQYMLIYCNIRKIRIKIFVRAQTSLYVKIEL